MLSQYLVQKQQLQQNDTNTNNDNNNNKYMVNETDTIRCFSLILKQKLVVLPKTNENYKEIKKERKKERKAECDLANILIPIPTSILILIPILIPNFISISIVLLVVDRAISMYHACHCMSMNVCFFIRTSFLLFFNRTTMVYCKYKTITTTTIL